jgi:tetratricopeptide (TPR) repeat protein
MDRKKDATGFRAPGFVVTRVLPASVLLALMVLLAALLGCQKQINSLSRLSPKIRPAQQTTRLVQNAEILKNSGRLELAVEELEKARLREPDNLEILDFLAQCYEDLGHFKRAQELYEQALSQAGPHPALENNRCYSLYLQGRLDEAEACFRKVLRRDPDNQAARNNLGLLLCRQSKEAEALNLWQEDMSDAEARQLLGKALAALGREVPPHLAAVDSTPRDRQKAVTSQPDAAPVSGPSESQAHLEAGKGSLTIVQAQPTSSPSLPASSQDRKVTATVAADRSPTEIPEEPAAQAPASAAATSPEKLVAKKPNHPTEQTPAQKAKTQTQPMETVAVSQTEKGESPAKTGTPGKEENASATPLTALGLWETEIELKNGNGVHNCARNLRSRLSREGFHVVSIANHIDFGLEETVIAYRPEATRVARVLAQKFFPEAHLEAEGKTSPWADIRVSLGHDLMVDQDLPDQAQEKVAAVEAAPLPPAAPVTEAASEQAPRIQKPPAAPTPGTDTPDLLASRADSRMRIELRNGNGVPGQARKMRRALWGEGFKVINIGNCKNYELKETVIAYRPEAADIAQVLSQKFFSGANLEEKANLPFWLDIRVLMGQDLVSEQKQLAQATP